MPRAGLEPATSTCLRTFFFLEKKEKRSRKRKKGICFDSAIFLLVRVPGPEFCRKAKFFFSVNAFLFREKGCTYERGTLTNLSYLGL